MKPHTLRPASRTSPWPWLNREVGAMQWLHLVKRHTRNFSDLCKVIFVRQKLIVIPVISDYFKLSACVGDSHAARTCCTKRTGPVGTAKLNSICRPPPLPGTASDVVGSFCTTRIVHLSTAERYQAPSRPMASLPTGFNEVLSGLET